MKLLIVTQTVDSNDLYLGFFHTWLGELSKRFDNITVLCLYEGHHSLPRNVRVFSLGKERGEVSKLFYVARFIQLILREQKRYDAVLVHMNQEYVLIGGAFWKLMGKSVCMWRNHYAGSLLTDIAIALCDKVFCTSKYSYTAKSAKTVLMPVGVDTDNFKAQGERVPRSVLFTARFSPSKRPHVLVEALGLLKERGVPFTASFYGSPLSRDLPYLEHTKKRAEELGLFPHAQFFPGLPNSQQPRIMSEHEVFVNLAGSGMYDKMLFEAMSCECLVLASSGDLAELVDRRFIFKENDAEDLAQKLEVLLSLSRAEKDDARRDMRELAVSKHSLKSLGGRLAVEIR